MCLLAIISWQEKIEGKKVPFGDKSPGFEIFENIIFDERKSKKKIGLLFF